jgi:hypothetical protein
MSRSRWYRGTTATSVFVVALCVAMSLLLILAVAPAWAVMGVVALGAAAVYLVREVRGGRA